MYDSAAIARSFGQAAEQYDRHAHLQQQVRRVCLDVTVPLMPDAATVLDLGCGTGVLRNEMIMAGRPDITLLGLDLAWGMCQQSKVHHLPVIQASSDAIPFAGNTLDGVFSSLMLQWASKPALVFAEIARVLRTGGRAVLSTLTDGTLKELKKSFASLDGAPHTSTFYTPHDILCCAEETGLTLKTARQETIVEYYPDTIALMRGIKAIGATNKHAGRNKGMMTPAKLAQLEQYYRQHYEQKQGLPVSWQVLILVLQKGMP